MDENDFTIFFLLNMMEACSLNEAVPGIICRVLLNNLFAQIAELKVKYVAKHQEIAFTKVESIRTEMLFDFVNKMKLTTRVNNDFYRQLAQKYLDNKKYHEAALIIHKFQFHNEFDCFIILEKLATTSRYPAARQLCELDEKFKIFLVNTLSTPEHCKLAAGLIKEFKYDLNDYPELKEKIDNANIKFYLQKFLYKKPGQEDNYSFDRIEDLFRGFRLMLSFLAEDLVSKNKLNEAKGVCHRHNLFHIIKEETRDKLNTIIYDPKKDPPHYDTFGPLTPEGCLSLPKSLKVEWVGTVDDIYKLDQLLKEPFIGVDTEWRPQLSKSHQTKPSLF